MSVFSSPTVAFHSSTPPHSHSTLFPNIPRHLVPSLHMHMDVSVSHLSLSIPPLPPPVPHSPSLFHFFISWKYLVVGFLLHFSLAWVRRWSSGSGLPVFSGSGLPVSPAPAPVFALTVPFPLMNEEESSSATF